MTIMFAGGMTIAIPGETPTAVAQTNTLSVSAAAAGVFGGAQVIEIVIDDPGLSEVGEDASDTVPDVAVDGEPVAMRQATTGKWYAYVADTSAYGASGLSTTGDFPTNLPDLAAGVTAWTTDPIHLIELEDGDEVEITAGRDESVTLTYDDHSDIATINVDRDDAPAGGQVHVTISDFQLNLDPTADDTWTLNVNNTLRMYDTTDPAVAVALPGTSGDLTITMSSTDVIKYSSGDGIVTIDETGSNTGVFESSNSDDDSEISVHEDASDGATFTVGYADNDQQVIVDDFSSTLELIADGTWDSGESLTIRLSSEDLNLNTLDDDDMTVASDDLPVLILGDPITLGTVASMALSDGQIGESISVNDAHVATLSATQINSTIDVTLTAGQNERLKDETMGHYAHLSTVLGVTTNAELEGATGETSIPNGLTAINVTNDADGIFNVTFAATAAMFADGVLDANTAIYAAVTAAEEAAVADNADASTVQSAAQNADGTPPTDFDDALTAIDTTDGDAASALAEVIAAANEHIVPTDFTIVADIFSFGADSRDAIYRALLEETSSGSGVFEGTVEYQILNQKTVDDDETHTGITTIDDELAIILNEGLTGTDGPTVTYDGDHVREDAPSHTGEVSFDAATYNVADEVTVILVDPDLNIDADGIDIYTVDATGSESTELLSLEIGGCTAVDGFGTLSMRETTDDSGTFEGTFEVPARCPADSTDTDDNTTGEDISATYYDFRDSSGSENEWGDSATIGADTGSVSLDRTVYPVPADDTTVTVYVSIEDADYDESSGSINSIADTTVTITVDGIDVAILGGADSPIDETSADSGVFEDSVDIGITMKGIGDDEDRTANVEQGSIITVKYDDPTDASGKKNSVSDSATFDLRNAVLTSDKSTYVIGQDAFLTLIEPDLNLDSASQETVPLTRIKWDSNAEGDTDLSNGAFGAVPANLRESGANTGVFHVSITIPEDIGGSNLERGEEITLTYEDNGPSGADSVGDDQRDVELSIETSNFGATLELDQNIYTWTDKVFITIVASDYNFDSNVIDEIGDEGDGEITVRIRNNDIETYNLAETGPDTGVFTGEVVLIGTTYEAGDNIDLTVSKEQSTGSGPTDGTIEADNGDGLSVSFEYSDSEAPLVASALIRWNVGEVQWLEASYAATGSGIVRVIDPDMNLNPDAVDNLDMVVHSETFLGGITLTVTETQEASGIFEGTVEFDPDEASQGHRLQVTEGDIVTAEYDDYTLPDGDDETIAATTLIGSIVPPLERAPASNPAIVDAFGTALASVSVDQQVQITADLTSGQDRDQDFAYLVQIQNEDGVTIALSWITGTLGAGATFSPSQSWTPSETGSYTATIFVWESVSNPTALSPQLTITIDVV